MTPFNMAGSAPGMQSAQNMQGQLAQAQGQNGMYPSMGGQNAPQQSEQSQMVNQYRNQANPPQMPGWGQDPAAMQQQAQAGMGGMLAQGGQSSYGAPQPMPKSPMPGQPQSPFGPPGGQMDQYMQAQRAQALPQGQSMVNSMMGRTAPGQGAYGGMMQGMDPQRAAVANALRAGGGMGGMLGGGQSAPTAAVGASAQPNQVMAQRQAAQAQRRALNPRVG
jgi:hypothetical protein